ncbi:MAG: PD-(D/E)XK nuclease family transposase, partial [Spirochaetia bacterium]|nr:PD-(D/E)XK nuclease family transposase [Spirochaetia bacterium]
IEMPKFNKNENELTTHFEKWLYFLKHLAEFESIPAILNEKVFKQSFKAAEIAALNKNQHEVYEQSLLQYWEMTSAIDTAFDDGIEHGIEQERLGTARKMIKKKIPVQDISEITGLSIPEIEKLKP